MPAAVFNIIVRVGYNIIVQLTRKIDLLRSIIIAVFPVNLSVSLRTKDVIMLIELKIHFLGCTKKIDNATAILSRERGL